MDHTYGDLPPGGYFTDSYNSRTIAVIRGIGSCGGLYTGTLLQKAEYEARCWLPGAGPPTEADLMPAVDLKRINPTESLLIGGDQFYLKEATSIEKIGPFIAYYLPKQTTYNNRGYYGIIFMLSDSKYHRIFNQIVKTVKFKQQ
jgi:hypothetical protein